MSANEDVTRFFGFVLSTVGGLIMVLSGLCSGGVLLFALGGGPGGHAGFAMVFNYLGVIALFGGIPFAVGWTLFAWGGGMMSPPKKYPLRTPPPPYEEGEL